jgi:hypothetical protein
MVRNGAQLLKVALPERFQQAIDRAAMGGGQAGSASYMEGWARYERPCSVDLQSEIDAEVANLEQRFPPVELERIITVMRAAQRSAQHRDENPGTANPDTADSESRIP